MNCFRRLGLPKSFSWLNKEADDLPEPRKQIFYHRGVIHTDWVARVASLFSTEGLNIRQIAMSDSLKGNGQSWLLINYEIPAERELSVEFSTALEQLAHEIPRESGTPEVLSTKAFRRYSSRIRSTTPKSTMDGSDRSCKP